MCRTTALLLRYMGICAFGLHKSTELYRARFPRNGNSDASTSIVACGVGTSTELYCACLSARNLTALYKYFACGLARSTELYSVRLRARTELYRALRVCVAGGLIQYTEIMLRQVSVCAELRVLFCERGGLRKSTGVYCAWFARVHNSTAFYGYVRGRGGNVY